MLKRSSVALVVIALIAVLFTASACAEPMPASVMEYGPGSGEATNPPSPSGLLPEAPGVPPRGPLDPTEWKVTEAEAISIASGHVPTELAANAKVVANMEVYGNSRTGERHIAWYAAFLDISVTRAWLGWQPDAQTTLEGEGPYNIIVVRLDGITGQLISRKAYFALPVGGPGMAPLDITPWTPAATDNASER